MKEIGYIIEFRQFLKKEDKWTKWTSWPYTKFYSTELVADDALKSITSVYGLTVDGFTIREFRKIPVYKQYI